MTSASDRAHAVGEFLKARRAELTPADLGLPDRASHRKVKGLRREEVADLAAISVDYYSRLEQGRVQPSVAVLETLVRALRLSEDQQAYLYVLADKSRGRPRRRRPQLVRPAMRRVLDQLAETPAIVLGRHLDILAWNEMATALFVDFDAIPARHRNYIRLLFTHPTLRTMHVQWEHDARAAVAALRMGAAGNHDDPDLALLVGELSLQDSDFCTWWASHQVNSATHGTKQYRHRVVGDIVLDCDVWGSPDGSGQQLMVLTAEPETPSHDALRLLASWTARDVTAYSGQSAAALHE